MCNWELSSFPQPASRRSARQQRGQANAHPPGAAVPAADSRGPFSASGGEPLTTLPVFPKAQHSLPHPKSSTSALPKTILLIDSSAHGTMRAAAGGPAVPSRSQAGKGVGGPPYSPGLRDHEAGAWAGYAASGGVLGCTAATSPPAAGAFPGQRRSDARLCARSAVLQLLLLLLLVLLLLFLAPSAASSAAGSSSPSLPLL